MTEKPKLVYDAPKRQHLYEWQVGEYLWASEPVFDRTREYVEVLEAENAKLRELVAEMRDCARDNSCARCYFVSGKCEFADRMHELGVEATE